MFWNNKPKSPITKEDELWVISSFKWFETVFSKDLVDQEIYLPTDESLGFKFNGTEDDVIHVTDFVAQKMGIDENAIELYFFEEFQPMEFNDEGIVSNYEEGTNLSNGLYSKASNGIYEIGIERALIKQPMKLIATIAHELTHIKLLGENIIEENDEPLTDLSASLFGFIIFLANSSINKMDTWSGNTHSGWKMGGGSGYLHYKIYAFLIAYWVYRKKLNKPVWLSQLDKEILVEVNRAIKYLESTTLN